MNTLIATKQESFGFHHTLVSNGSHDENEAAIMFDHVATQIADIEGVSVSAARRILDSRVGRHMADQFEDCLMLFHTWMKKRRFYSQMLEIIDMTDEEFYA